jgi:cullin 3
MGNADVRVSFDKKVHDLNVSTFALVILLLFEGLADDEFLTYEVGLMSSFICNVTHF